MFRSIKMSTTRWTRRNRLLWLVCLIGVLAYFLTIDLFQKRFRAALETSANDGELGPTFTGGSSNCRLSHILMTFHIKQLPKVRTHLESWNEPDLEPCSFGSIYAVNELVQLPTFVFYVGYSLESDGELLQTNETITELWQQSKYRYCFNGYRVSFYQMDASSDSHVTGARLMFEHALKGAATGNDTLKYILYMEPDLRPLQRNWVIKALLETMWPQHEFWVKGSVFRGDNGAVSATGYLPNLYHINGNAFYNMGDAQFRSFYFDVLRPYIVSSHGDSMNAYDTDFFEYFMDRRNYDTVRHIMHKFVYTNVIQNMWSTTYSRSQLVSQHPNTFFAHGGSQVP